MTNKEWFKMKILNDPICVEEHIEFEKTYYIFNYHRTSFLCWVRAFNEGLIPKGNTLITIDLHLDLMPIKDLKKEHLEMAKRFNLEEIRKNVLRNNSQDWIQLGMETGIIDNAVIISPCINLRADGVQKEDTYLDTSGNKHNVVYFDSIEDFEKSFEAVNDKYILDIDLDYFHKNRKSFWNLKRIPEKEISSYFKKGSKISNVFSKSRIVTLATEQSYTLGKGVSWVTKQVLPSLVQLEEDTIKYRKAK